MKLVFVPLLMWVLILLSANGANAQAVATPAGIQAKVEITKPADSSKDTILALVESVAWPLTVFILILAFRKPIRDALEQFGRQGGEIAIAGLALKLPAMRDAPLGEDVLTFKAGDPYLLVNDSTKSTLLRLLKEPGFRDYVVVNLGEGDQWITSRLFIFAIMLQRIKQIRCFVFLEGSRPRFIGAAKPDQVRWALAKEQPWLEKAFVDAVVQSSPYGFPIEILNNEGAIAPAIAEEVVRAFVQKLSNTPPAGIIPGEKPWATFTTVGTTITTTEYATWLSGADVVRMLGDSLHTDAIIKGADSKQESRALLACSAPWVARLTSAGTLESVIDRIAFLNEVGAKVLNRLETQSAKTN